MAIKCWIQKLENHHLVNKLQLGAGYNGLFGGTEQPVIIHVKRQPACLPVWFDTQHLGSINRGREDVQ